MTGARVRAPELRGRRWLNTGGRSYSLADFRGRFLLLDFWTSCCVNCLHVLDELRPLEEAYADVLVVVGVHSPKFVHEGAPAAVDAAVERLEVGHPVLDDPDLETWQQYAVRAWPTLVLVDPEGYVVAQHSGEGHAHALARTLARLVAEHDSRRTLRRGEGPYVPPPPREGLLAFPGKAVLLPDGDLLVADTAHHRLVRLGPDDAPRAVVGSGERGRVDGDAATARFSEPGGMAVLPTEVSGEVGYDVLVADTVNHVLRGLDTATGSVRTVAGTGRQWMQGEPTAGPAGEVALSSPWDLAWFDGAVVVASAGVHRLDRFDPVAGTIAPYAGTTQEGLVDGELDRAWLAQPSGLAASADGTTLWFVDAETSALRRVRHGVVHTVVGHGLFDFGHVDGPAGQALLQHPLGVAALPDGSVLVADTYNGALRRYDPASDAVTTLAEGLAEPSDVLVVPDEVRGHVVAVVESAAHRVTRVAAPPEALVVPEARHRTHRPPTLLAPGSLQLRVVFDPPPGQKLDDRYGSPTHLVVSASPAGLLAHGAGSGAELQRMLVLSDEVLDGVLHVSVRAASCDDPDAPGAAEFPACHVHQQDWGVPVRLVRDGPQELTLVLAGGE